MTTALCLGGIDGGEYLVVSSKTTTAITHYDDVLLMMYLRSFAAARTWSYILTYNFTPCSGRVRVRDTC